MKPFQKKLLKDSEKSRLSIMSSKALRLSKICGKTWEQNPQQNSLISFDHIFFCSSKNMQRLNVMKVYEK